jgi:hypothetical protein
MVPSLADKTQRRTIGEQDSLLYMRDRERVGTASRLFIERLSYPILQPAKSLL